MVLLILACICLPAKITFVNFWDHQVHLVWWLVFQMHICSLSSSSLFNSWFTLLSWWCFSFIFVLCQINRSNLVLSNDHILLHLWRDNFFSLFVIVLLGSSCMETLSLMLFHSKLLASNWWDFLKKSHHCFIALRVEFIIVSWLKSGKFNNSILVCFWIWVFSNGWF